MASPLRLSLSLEERWPSPGLYSLGAEARSPALLLFSFLGNFPAGTPTSHGSKVVVSSLEASFPPFGTFQMKTLCN